MAESRRVRTLRTPPSEATFTPMPGGVLPADLLREASRRLGIIARFFIVMPVFVMLVWHLLLPRFQIFWPTGPLDAIATAAALLSVGVFLATRRRNAAPASLITLGLAFEVALAALLASADHIIASPAVMTLGPIVPRVLVILLAFPIFVPSTPRRTFVAAFLAASMDPIAMALAIQIRHLDVAPWHILLMHIPDYVGVVLAVLMSRVITGLGRHVRDARDLGSYRLGDMLGRGGMGEVYVAHHRMLARPAAIKLIRPEKLEGDGDDHARRIVQRFTREAQAAASLRSPHTIELYDFGQTEDGTLYFVMELLEGVDLDSFVERFGPMPSARAVHVLRQACDSLGEAHARDLIHRDVKPANIHLCRMGLLYDFVKVLDFGIVKSLRGPHDEHALATAADRIIGTPAFMPPEMARGEPVDARADLYCLGCVAHWLLTGKLVFGGDSSFEVVAQHLNGVPKRASIESPFPVPPALDDVILSCLAKDPAHRPQTARELSDRLAAVAMPMTWSEEAAAHWWRDHLPPADESSAQVTEAEHDVIPSA